MQPFTNQTNVIMLWAIIIVAALGAGAGFKYWVVPWLNLWVHNAVAKWWINIFAPIAIVLGVIVWGAFWTGSFGYMYHEVKVRLPRLEFFADVGDAWNRTKAAWEGDVKTATEPTAVPSDKAPDPSKPQGQSQQSAPAQADDSSPTSSTDTAKEPATAGGNGQGCASGWCANGNCPDGCGNVGAAGYVCRNGEWASVGREEWSKAAPCPGK